MDRTMMKAAFIYGLEDIKVKETKIPHYRGNEALIRVKACSICPSDLRYFLGHKIEHPYGDESTGLSGHEWAGEVLEIGRNVKNVSRGDKVVADLIGGCRDCKFCKIGKFNLCPHRTPEGNRGFAEYLVINSSRLLKFSQNLPFNEACMVEPVACCLNGNMRAQIEKADNVVIIGAGPIGLIHLQLVKASSARAIVSDINGDRLRIAKELGADEVVNPLKIDIGEEIKGLTDGYGADAVIVAVGNKAATEQSFRIIGKNGRIVLFAGTYPPIKVELDPNLIHYGEVILTGSSDYNPFTFVRALKLVSSGIIDVKSLTSHILPLDKIEEGFRITQEAKHLRVVIEL